MKHFLVIGSQVAWQQTSCSLEDPPPSSCPTFQQRKTAAQSQAKAQEPRGKGRGKGAACKLSNPKQHSSLKKTIAAIENMKTPTALTNALSALHLCARIATYMHFLSLFLSFCMRAVKACTGMSSGFHMLRRFPSRIHLQGQGHLFFVASNYLFIRSFFFFFSPPAGNIHQTRN